MKFSAFTRYKTGVLVPVFALRSDNSCGTGEFFDLIPLADWCNKTGLDLVQLLPVNDTGDDASPYNALSAFALQPIFISIEAIPEYATLPSDVRKKVDLNLVNLKSLAGPLQYSKVRSLKLETLKIIYNSAETGISKDADFSAWVKEHSWVRDYGVFMALKDQNQRSSWQVWKDEFKRGSSEVVEKLWKTKDLATKALQWAWVQYRLEQQFLKVAQYYDDQNIALKGDIPIMMNEDSVDVWSQRENFVLDLRAGAPPDMFSPSGQNWGFPTYDWEYLADHDYAWWRKRLAHADKFYHAFRIDHVLGFFRIWAIPEENSAGLMGYFNPSIHISENELIAAGFDKGRVRWLSEPHIPGQRLQDLFGMRSFEIIGRCFDRLGNEELYLFKPELQGEKSFNDLPLMEDEKQALLSMYRDRALITLGENLYSPTWSFRDCWRYQIMGDNEKSVFEALVKKHRIESELIWEKQGERLLGFMKSSVSMLACAEDLGVVPDCVPVSLKKLGVLSLKIPRWAKRYDFPGEPYIAPVNYPWLSVCAASVHDTSTLRQWWEEEADKDNFWRVINGTGLCPREYSSDTAFELFRCIMMANSAICVFQLQDFFGLLPDYLSKSTNDRMNIPGTVGIHNWSWRMEDTLEVLQSNGQLNRRIIELVKERKKRPVKKD